MGISIDDLAKIDSAIANVNAIRHDHWENVMTNLGVEGKDHRRAASFRRGRQISQAEYELMYLEDPFFARIVDTKPKYATKNWIRPSGTEASETFGKDLIEALEKLKAQFQVYDLYRFAQLDGGAAMIIAADDGLKPEEPLNLERVKTVKRLQILRRYEISPLEIDNDPLSDTFREPKVYTIGATAQNIHASRVIRLRGIYLSDNMSASTGEISALYWGMPIAQRVIDALRQFHSIWGHVEATFKDLNQGVIAIKDLASLLATQQGNEKIIKRLQLMALTASTFNAVLIEPEVETYEKRPHGGLSGISDILDRSCDHLCAVAEIPKTKLFGVVPGGLGKDDQSGDRTFNASVAVDQERLLREPVRRICEVVMAAKDGPTGGKIPEDWSFAFNPIEEENEDDVAERRRKSAETDKTYFDIGVLSEAEIRSRLSNDPDSPYTLDPEFDKMLAEKPLEPEPEDPVLDPELEASRDVQ